jgi:hypothetical protein
MKEEMLERLAQFDSILADSLLCGYLCTEKISATV